MKFLKRFLATVFPTSQLHNSRTVRYAFSFSFLFLFATVLGMAAVTTKSGSSVRIITDQSFVEQGSVFSVDVFVYASQPVNAVDLAISFPADQVDILGIDRGESVLTLWTEDPHVEGSAVVLRGGTYKKGFVGEHKIATINARAKTTGQAKFIAGSVKLLAGDGLGSNVEADTSSVAETAIVPVGGVPAASLKANGTVVVVTDVDGDGGVTLRDISSFMASWTGNGSKYDFNNDGAMTFKDFSIILADYFTRK
jgi:hypothetical protein